MTMMTDLTNSVMNGDNGSVPTLRFNLQTAYTEMLINILANKSYDGISQASALAQLKSIEKIPVVGSEEFKAHIELLKNKIKIALEK
jgi:hypothetical protein